MEELAYIHESILQNRLEEALLFQSLNFSQQRSFRVFHSLRWRIFFGLLTVSVNTDTYTPTWTKQTMESESRWKSTSNALKQRLEPGMTSVKHRDKKGRFGDSDSDDDSTEGNVADNPLLPSNESSYAFRYKVDLVRATAQKDIDRLHWELPLFEDAATRDTLMDILVNYCILYDREYKQGMHEIAAFIYYVTHTDASLVEKLQEQNVDSHIDFIDNFATICHCSYSTAVTFELFDTLMKPSGLHLESWYYCNHDHPTDGIMAAAQLVQGDQLALVEPTLHNQMNVVYGIESTSYLIRWLRLLFLREFSLTQCADLWDVFFSERFLSNTSAFQLIGSTVTMVATSMLLFVMDELMVGHVEALLRVMKYPPLEDVGIIVERTLIQFDPHEKGIRKYFTPPNMASIYRNVTVHHGPAPSPPQIQTSASKEQSNSDEIMLRQGMVLSSIIEHLENHWFPSETLSSEEKDHIAHNYVHSIAELKRVRDVLLRHVEDEP